MSRLSMQWFGRLALAFGAFAVLGLLSRIQPQTRAKLDVPFEPTHPEVVQAMLRAAAVTANDYVIDLGCGDGRIVVAAAKEFGARGLGVDIDPQRIRESRENAAQAGVERLVEFKQGNILEMNLRDATVVTMYLLNRVNLMLRPKLFRDLRPGTRVVSHAFDMGEWEPDRVVRNAKARGNVVYYWVIPAPVGGAWRWTEDSPSAGQAPPQCTLSLLQQFQGVSGTLSCSGSKPTALSDVKMEGKDLSFTVAAGGAERGRIRYHGAVEGDTIRGTWEQGAARHAWVGKRDPVSQAGCWALSSNGGGAPDGTLCITPQDAGPSLTFCAARRGDDKPEPKVSAFYAWGTSVRFEIQGRDTPVIFTGVLDGDSGQGEVAREGWPSPPRWTASRLAGVTSATACSATTPSAPPPAAPGQAGSGAAPAAPPSEYVSAIDGSVLVRIPGGRFFMGTDDGPEDERPRHEVAVGEFWLGKHEVTNAQYANFLKANPDSQTPMYWDDSRFNQPDQPVIGVTWNEAESYCQWAGLRLPTEAEWEYAAAAGKQLRYPTATGEPTPGLANTRGVQGADRWEYTSPVGSFPPNPFGVFDLAGNAWEWTSSLALDYPFVPGEGREAGDSRSLREMRGGSWHFPFEYCRTAARHPFAAHLRYDYVGIRVALTTPKKAKSTQALPAWWPAFAGLGTAAGARP